MARKRYHDKMSGDLTKAGQGVIQQLAHKQLEDDVEQLKTTVGEADTVTLVSLGGAALTEPFVTIGNTSGLSAERALTGTTNQITVTDGGANSTATLSTPQNLHTEADFQVDTIGVGAAAAANTKVSVTNDAATDVAFHGIAHASQSADLWRLRNSADSTNLASFDSTGKLIATTGLRNPHNTELPASTVTLTSNPIALDIGNTSNIRLNANAFRQLRGITGGTDGRLIVVVSHDSTAFQINHEDTGASAANRIITGNAQNFSPLQRAAFFLLYDATTARWRVLNWASQVAEEIITGSWTFAGAQTIFDTGNTVGINGAVSSTPASITFSELDSLNNVAIIYRDDVVTGDQEFIQDLQSADGFIALQPFQGGMAATDTNVMTADGDVLTADGEILLTYAA